MTEIVSQGGQVSRSTRFLYGFGLAAEGVKNNTFNVFLLFFYQQVVGLDAALCGIAVLITLLVDAIGDPLIGSFSDGFRSRWGRRLPFMYMASLPLALMFYLVMSPPAGQPQWVLFLWLTVFASATRFSMALFWLPHQSLVVELSDDFATRTSLQNFRNIFAWLFGLLNVWLGYNVFLATTPEYPVGVLNPAGYALFAVWGSCAMLVATLVCTFGIHRVVMRAPATHRKIDAIPVAAFPRAMLGAVQGSGAYRAALAGGLLMWIAFGLTENMRNYISPWFWGLSSEQTSYLIYVIVLAAVIVWMFAGGLTVRFGKRRLATGAMLLFAISEPTAMGLRLAGLFPANDSPLLMPLLLGFWFLGFFGIITAMTVWGTMIGDITDEYELRSGSRQEGLLFAGGTFLQKAALGGGGLVFSNLLLFAQFPENTGAAGVDPESVRRLATALAVCVFLFGLLAALGFSRYGLTREKHVQILQALAGRRQAGSPGTQAAG